MSSSRMWTAIAVLAFTGHLLAADDRGIDVRTGEHRVALVIGNGAYPDGPLKNPPNDARAVAAALREVGFEVTELENGSQAAMKRAIQRFGHSLKRESVGVFYYAGHGIQARGKNWLVPVDAAIETEGDLELWAIDLDGVLAQIEDADNRLNVIVLDACRNNPFARGFRSASRGLASVNAPGGTLIAYATAPGSVASDGDESNGLYTQELLRQIRTPGLTVEEVFKRVRIRVRERSGGKQIPWESSSLMGDFYFADGRTPAKNRPIASTVSPTGVALSPPQTAEVSRPARPTPASPTLAVARPTSRGNPRLKIVEPVREMGTVPQGEKLNWTFSISNGGSGDLQILAATPGCGCTVVDFDKVIGPGQTGKVNAHVDTTGFAGPIAKSVTLETNDPDFPTAQLSLHAIVKPYVDAYPAGFVRFNVVQGQEVTQSVILYSSEEDRPFEVVRIDVPVDWISAAFRRIDGGERVPSVGKEGQTQYRIALTIHRNAQIGPLAEKVHIITNSRHQPDYYMAITGVVVQPKKKP